MIFLLVVQEGCHGCVVGGCGWLNADTVLDASALNKVDTSAGKSSDDGGPLRLVTDHYQWGSALLLLRWSDICVQTG